MRKSFKTALCTILGVCLIAAVLSGCAQTGNERALGPNGLNNGTNNRLNYGTQNQGFNRNNLTGSRYGYNGYTGNTGRNLAGGDGNTGNDPSNFLGYNGVNTIQNNNRFNRMGNTGTGMGNNGYSSGYNGALTGNNGYSSGYNGMLTGNNGTNAMNGNDKARASMIERQLNNVNGVNNCSVLVSGDTALVGLRTNNATNISRLRSSIERRIKQMDSSIKNVKVTDSPDILTRMGRLGTTGNYNGMANNFMQEFKNMLNSMNNTRR